MTLLIILICLFLSLAILIRVAEKFGSPLQPEQSQRYSKIIIILMGLLLLASGAKMLFG